MRTLVRAGLPGRPRLRPHRALRKAGPQLSECPKIHRASPRASSRPEQSLSGLDVELAVHLGVVLATAAAVAPAVVVARGHRRRQRYGLAALGRQLEAHLERVRYQGVDAVREVHWRVLIPPIDGERLTGLGVEGRRIETVHALS